MKNDIEKEDNLLIPSICEDCDDEALVTEIDGKWVCENCFTNKLIEEN